MSTSAVKKLKRVYQITHTDWSGGVLTVNTNIPHFMVAGDEVTILYNNGPQVLKGIVSSTGTVGTSKSFTIPCANNLFVIGGTVELDYFTGGTLLTTVDPVGLGNGVLGVMSAPSSFSVHRCVQITSSAASTFGAIKITGSIDCKNFSELNVYYGSANEGLAFIGIPNNTTAIYPGFVQVPMYRFNIQSSATGALLTTGRLYISMC